MADDTREAKEAQQLIDCTVEEVKSERPRLYEDIGKQWAEENMDRLGIEADRDVRHRIDILIQENEELRAEITETRKEREQVQNRIEVDHMILQSGLPRELDTKLFRELCYESRDAHGPDKVEAMIEDRRASVGRFRPVSREQGSVNHLPVMDGKSFISSCRK